MKVIVTNIQRFCLHDGPGIRTTVFFKGCNLRCPWCSNPENIDFNIQDYIYNGKKGTFGKEYSLDELEREILKDQKYYSTGGGVTFSGGEPLFKMKSIEPLLIKLKSLGINMCVETALTVPDIDIAIKYIDEFIVDIKILDETAKTKINGDNKLFIKNIQKLFKNNKNVKFRIPLVPDFTYTKNNIDKILELLKKYKPECVELFETHNLSEEKYKSLNLEIKKFKKIKKEEIDELCNRINKLGIKCTFIKI